MAFGAHSLERYPLVVSDEPEAIRLGVGRVFCDYGLLVPGRDVQLDGRFHGLSLSASGLYYLDYGTEVRIDIRDLDVYSIQVPMAGRAFVSTEAEKFVSTPERASLLQPGRRVSMTLEPANSHLLVRLDQPLLQTVLRKKLGHEIKAPIDFEPQMDLTTPGNRMFRQLLHLLVSAVDADADASSLAIIEYEMLLVSQLLAAQPNNYSDELHRRPRAAVARTIARAAELIEEGADQPLSMDDVAATIGISARALRDGFRQYFDTTPTAYLRNVRLRRVRTELLYADPARVTVTSVALRWGFSHLGRFSVWYRERFGETPSDTLRLENNAPSGRT